MDLNNFDIEKTKSCLWFFVVQFKASFPPNHFSFASPHSAFCQFAFLCVCVCCYLQTPLLAEECPLVLQFSRVYQIFIFLALSLPDLEP